MRSNRNNSILKTGIIAIILVSIAVYFFTNFERYEYEKNKYNQDYLRNDYYLLETYLNSLNIKTTVSKNSSELLLLNEDIKNLAIFDSYSSFTRTSTPKIKEWVKNGGTLITTVTQYPTDDEKEFLLEFGASNEAIETDDYSDIGCYAENSAFIDCENQELINAYSEHTVLASNRYGNAYIEIPYGDGRIVFFAYSYYFPYQNNNLKEKDNAYFFTSLLNLNDDGKTLIIYDTKQNSLFAALFRNAKISVILFLILVITLLWSLIQRFGPLRQLRLETQQDLKQHLQACADYSWEAEKLETHIKAYRELIFRQLRNKTGRKLPESNAQKLEFIESYFTQQKNKPVNVNIRNVLFSTLPNDEAQLLTLTNDLQNLRSYL